MVDPIRTFELYIAIKTHFTTKKYDAVKQHGRVKNAGRSQFEKRRDKNLIIQFCKQFNTQMEATSALVANCAYGNDYPFSELLEAKNNYTHWQKNRQSLSKVYTEDLTLIRKYCIKKGMKFKDVVACDNEMPELFKAFVGQHITIETLSILNTLFNFVTDWNDCPYLIAWKGEVLRIDKLSSFIKFDKEKYLKLFEEIINE